MANDNAHNVLKLKEIFASVQGYVEAQMALFKLEVHKEMAALVTKLFVFLIVALFFTLFIFAFTMGLGFWLNTLLDSAYLGFVLLAGIYLLLGLLCLWVGNRPKTKEAVRQRLDRMFSERVGDSNSK